MKASMHGIAVILAQHDTTICSGENITLHAPSGYMSYLWSDGETTQNIVVDTSGTYWVTAQELDSCLGTSNSVTIIVAPDPSPAITHSGSLQFCDGGSVTLSAPAGFSSYQWSNGDTSRSIVVKTAGRISVTVTNAYGCTGSSSAFTTSLIPLPKIDVNDASNNSLCGKNGTQQAMIRNLSSIHYCSCCIRNKSVICNFTRYADDCAGRFGNRCNNISRRAGFRRLYR